MLPGFTVFVVRKSLRERIGLFDENFWPAYAEDCDYLLRARLSGLAVYDYALLPRGVCFAHGEVTAGRVGSLSLHAHGTDVHTRALLSQHNNHAHFCRKWRIDPAAGHESGQNWCGQLRSGQHTRPFGRDVPLSHWAIDGQLRNATESLWRGSIDKVVEMPAADAPSDGPGGDDTDPDPVVCAPAKRIP
eukprot:TRINITY_DN14557_c0_g1_i1.p3 TRINITY_DN14557_c0_g1~~TRINITY_DN14557_c0_g1_i1.p3  ORF type:complete len:189 (+),score=31.14 TRINITY_DN14557_c0_g1_i1:914-1480(+)